MIDIGETMRRLLEELQTEGINDVLFPDAGFDGEASADYGCLCNLYPDDFGQNYFDHDACREDFVDRVKGAFAGDPTVKLSIDGFNSVEAVRQ